MTRPQDNPFEPAVAGLLHIGKNQALSHEFQRLALTFYGLRETIARAETACAEVPGSDAQVGTDEPFDECWATLFNVAFKISKCTARTPEELAIKASVLLEYAEADDTDLISVLTRSLCTDFLDWLQTSRVAPPLGWHVE